MDLSFKNSSDLRTAIAALIEKEESCEALVSLTLSIARIPGNDEYQARLLIEKSGQRTAATYISKYARRYLSSGSAKDFDSELPLASNTRQLVLSGEFFRELKREVDLSRYMNRPLKTDWREYKDEEERDAFHRRLGARSNSRFLHLGVDTNVTWPKEPMRVEFGGHHLVLFPKTREYSHSISIDLQNESISVDEARTLINRFLSVLSWCDNRYAILREGWSGNPIPMPVRRRDLAFMTAWNWVFFRSIPEDKELLNCLSYYREGLNAAEVGIASQELLSFFKVFEMKRDGREVRRWIADVFDTACAGLNPTVVERFQQESSGVPVEKYVYENCRVAAAHASKNYPSDADMWKEAQRLSVAADITQALARYYIRTEFGFSESYLSDGAAV